MLKRIYKRSNPEKPENPVPEDKNIDVKHTDVENEEKNESDPDIKKSEPEQVEDDLESTEAVPEMTDSSDANADFGSDETTDVVSEESDDELNTLQKELSELHDKYLRLAAEFDNYRKRTLREKSELIQTAGESLLKDILPVVDDFERGLEQASKADDMDAVRTGMDLIYSKLKDFLTNHGVKEIEAIHEPFDTDWHEAITNIPAPSDDLKGKIVDVIQKGYTLHDKVIRYPKVVVGE